MFQTALLLRESANDIREKWFRSPVSFYKGNLAEISAHIPAFERRSYSLTEVGNKFTRLNEHLDSIVRMPFDDDNTFIPVGVVSKEYALVPHSTVLEFVTRALDTAKIPPADVKAELRITQYSSLW